MVSNAVKHHFKRFRAHQMKVANSGGGMLTIFPSGRTETTFASSPFGEHALSALMSARRHIAFMERSK